MFDNIHENTPNSQNLWSELELSLSDSFNAEAAKDKPHPNAERKKKKKSDPSMGAMGGGNGSDKSTMSGVGARQNPSLGHVYFLRSTLRGWPISFIKNLLNKVNAPQPRFILEIPLRLLSHQINWTSNLKFLF